jgi:hypothetical protein
MEKIEKLIDMAHIIEEKYSKFSNKMGVLFCYQVSPGKSIIFQELKHFAFTDIIVNPSCNLFLFTVNWNAVDKEIRVFDNKIRQGTSELEWEEIPGIGQNVLNSSSDRIGIPTSSWYLQKYGDNRVALDFKVENIKRINCYKWGFTIISDTISIVSLKYGTYFRDANLKYDFSFLAVDTTEITNQTICSENEKDIQEYWSSGEINYEDDNFDDQLNRKILGAEKRKIPNVGQKTINNMILED